MKNEKLEVSFHSQKKKLVKNVQLYTNGGYFMMNALEKSENPIMAIK
jgi:hypothetical protein